MPYCHNCGYNDIDDSYIYCPHCGDGLKAGSWVAPVVSDSYDDINQLNHCNHCGYSAIDKSYFYCPHCGEALSVGSKTEAMVPERHDVVYQEAEPEELDLNPDQIKVVIPNPKTGPKIGGWLIIFHLHLSLILTAYFFGTISYTLDVFSILRDNITSIPLSERYFKYFLLISNFSLWAATFRTYLLFWNKSRKTPSAILLLFWAVFIKLLVEAIWSYFIVEAVDYRLEIHITIFALVLVIIAIYSIAFKRSKRAKATFIH